MSRFTSKEEFLADIRSEREKLDELLDRILTSEKLVEVVDGMSVKDYLTHRTEWGRMMLRWYREAAAGGEPSVPTADYKWNQLAELNAEIHERFAETPLATIESQFAEVHDELVQLIDQLSDDELFTKQHHRFTDSPVQPIWPPTSTAQQPSTPVGTTAHRQVVEKPWSSVIG